jgi:hypothetical protein
MKADFLPLAVCVPFLLGMSYLGQTLQTNSALALENCIFYIFPMYEF